MMSAKKIQKTQAQRTASCERAGRLLLPRSEVPDFLVRLVGWQRLKTISANPVWRPRHD